jgi:DNA-binding NtrC family response regulator
MTAAAATLRESVEQNTRAWIVAAMEVHGGHRARAARELGISPDYLRRRIVSLGLGPTVAQRWPCQAVAAARKK